MKHLTIANCKFHRSIRMSQKVMIGLRYTPQNEKSDSGHYILLFLQQYTISIGNKEKLEK